MKNTKRRMLGVLIGVIILLIFFGMCYLVLIGLGNGPFWLFAKGLLTVWLVVIMIFCLAMLNCLMNDNGVKRLEFEEIFGEGRTEFGIADFIYFTERDDLQITQLEKKAGMVLVCIDRKSYSYDDRRGEDYKVVRTNGLPLRMVLMHFVSDSESGKDYVDSISIIEGLDRNYCYESRNNELKAYRLVIDDEGDDVYVDENTLLALYEARYLGNIGKSQVLKESLIKEGFEVC